MSGLYGKEFYGALKEARYRSASLVVPIVLGLFNAKSVVDFGCGVGAWLRAFQECGVRDILGLDGHWVDANQLEIPSELFRPADLCKPVSLPRRYDLATCLEVAEHLPPDAADVVIDSLIGLASVVLFSAAIPGQGGVGHVNEQWQDYWVSKFANRSYMAIDVIRPKIWSNANVSFWYRQNIILYAHAKHELASIAQATWSHNRVHPDQLTSMRNDLTKYQETLNARSGRKSLLLIKAGFAGLTGAIWRKLRIRQ